MWWIDLLWRVSLSVLNSIKFGCHGYLSEWESMKCPMPQSGRYFALTSRYSIAIYILTTHFWNFKASSIFCKRWENFASHMNILKKVSFFDNTPSWKLFRSKQLCTLEIIWRTKFLVTFDGFHGRESISVDFMIKIYFL